MVAAVVRLEEKWPIKIFCTRTTGRHVGPPRQRARPDGAVRRVPGPSRRWYWSIGRCGGPAGTAFSAETMVKRPPSGVGMVDTRRDLDGARGSRGSSFLVSSNTTISARFSKIYNNGLVNTTKAGRPIISRLYRVVTCLNKRGDTRVARRILHVRKLASRPNCCMKLKDH
jgi:hypothetical protein